MRRLLVTSDSILQLLLRLTLVVVFFPHAAQRVLGWLGGPGLGGATAGLAPQLHLPAALVAVALVAELLGVVALFLGFAARAAALALACNLAAALALVHGGTGTFADPLVQLPHVYGTHHIGASTDQAQHAVADEVVHIVQTFVRTGNVPHCVNLCHRSPARWQMIVHHLDRVGVLARVLAAIERHGINVEEMENTIFDGAVAACCTLRLGSRPGGEVLDEIRRVEHVMHGDVNPLD